MSAADGRILIDVTRDFAAQVRGARSPDVVLLTHAHRDACGGLPELERRLASGRPREVTVLAGDETIRRVRKRHRRLDHLRFVAVGPGASRRWRGWRISALQVPHARDCSTFAWKLARPGLTLVYASDVARLTAGLRSFSAGADLLVIDGAMWRGAIFSHLSIPSAWPVLAGWPVRRLLLTQIGRSTPPHAALDRWLRARCPRGGAAHDGLTLRFPAAEKGSVDPCSSTASPSVPRKG